MSDIIPEALLRQAADDLARYIDRRMFGVDLARGRDHTVLTVAVPVRDVNIAVDLERMRAMIPRPIEIVVVPDAWIEEPLRIEEPLSFVLRRSDMGRIRSVVDFDLPLSCARVIEIPDPTPPPRRASKGWRRHVRRMKAAGLWRRPA